MSDYGPTSTIHALEFAASAVEMLADRLAGEECAEPRDVTAPFTLVVRESTVGRQADCPAYAHNRSL